jgi:2'-5' RNA ligase
MRLFVALDLPQKVIERLEDLLAQLRPTAPLQWSPPGNLHVTTKFIGEWPEERLGEMTAALKKVPRRPPIAVHVHKVGFFPNPHSPRVFWCGIEAPDLPPLAADTDRATAALGVESEKREYSPHLTLARNRDPKTNLQALREKIASLPALDFGSFEASSFFLYRSQLRPGGSLYTKLAEFPLSNR